MTGKEKIMSASGLLLLGFCDLESSAKEVSPGVFSCEVAQVSPKFLKDIARANERIEQLFDSVDFPTTGQTEIAWTPGFNGEVSAPKITRSCGEPAVDLACLEAVLSASPEGVRMHLAETRRIIFTAKTKGVQNSGKRVFLRNNPPDGMQYLVYIIPLSFSSRYPTLFSASELQTEDNVAAIKTSTPQEAQRKILQLFESWSNFSRDNRNPSKEAIKETAIGIKNVLIGKDETSRPQG